MNLSLTRITDRKKIIPEIEGLRFVSILLVVLSHIHNNTLRAYPESLQSIVENRPLAVFMEECGAGVDIFFFISGFILAIPFLRAKLYHTSKVSLKRYYYRRLTRIEPPYLITLTVFLFIVIFGLHQEPLDALEHYTASAFYLHNILYNHISTINPVASTLEVEVQYYLVAPFIATLFFKNRVVRRITLILFFILICSGYLYNFSLFEQLYLRKSLFSYFNIFITGIICADWFLENQRFLYSKKRILFDFLGIASLYCIITLSGFTARDYRLFLFACYFMFFISAFKGKLLNKVVTNKYITIIGGMCYSIYLLHYAVIFFITQTFTHRIFSLNYAQDILLQLLIIMPLILVFSSAFFVFFERPFMDIHWAKKLIRYIQRKLGYLLLYISMQSAKTYVVKKGK